MSAFELCNRETLVEANKAIVSLEAETVRYLAKHSTEELVSEFFGAKDPTPMGGGQCCIWNQVMPP